MYFELNEEDAPAEDNLQTRLKSQRALLESQKQQDDRSTWLMIQFRAHLLRPGDVGENHLTFLQCLGMLNAVYDMFVCLWQSSVMYDRMSACCVCILPACDTQKPPPRGLNCEMAVADFYGIAMMTFRLYGIIALFYLVPSILMYNTVQESACNQEEKQLLRRELKLVASFVGWASALPLIWINSIMLQYVDSSSSPGSKHLAIAQILFGLGLFPFNSYAFFCTPLWSFIRHNLVLRSRLVFTMVPALILFPLSLSYYLGEHGGGAGNGLLLITWFFGVFGGAVITRLLKFASPELASFTFSTVLCYSVFLLVLNTLYFLIQQSNRTGTGIYAIPPLYIMWFVLMLQVLLERRHPLAFTTAMTANQKARDLAKQYGKCKLSNLACLHNS